jgi:hypothetical protein
MSYGRIWIERVSLGLGSIGNPGLDRGPSECYNR